LTPGHDVVGRIVAVGSQVKEFQQGDRVAALVQTGGNARYLSILATSLVRVPTTVDAAEAACMVSVYTTAYQCLKQISTTTTNGIFSLTGKKILVIGGMDGVGQALVQMCNKARADVYATCPARRQTYMTTVLGATPLPEDSSSWQPLVQGNMDVVLNGRCEDGLDAAARQALTRAGELICFGQAAMVKESTMGVLGAPVPAFVNKLINQLTRTKRVDIWDSFNEDPEQFKVRHHCVFCEVHLGKNPHSHSGPFLPQTPRNT
jgi:NADPH:quinone reductase-like Zn-dependent oxidoreductase